MKNVFLGPQDVTSGSGEPFLSKGDEVKIRRDDSENPVKGYVISTQQEDDRSLEYVIRTEDDEIDTTNISGIVAVRSQSTGEWFEL